eukprot:TRINITY_DN3048_c0_g1_i1.p1 TRINITY_DN3048_c0_g1~~TRINITY_DN3048_c0_g1_i1.p1  ORF type:complete len:71 (-),score=4.08 TRINITY_DN3048_c0_g1_i1:27-239(-)
MESTNKNTNVSPVPLENRNNFKPKIFSPSDVQSPISQTLNKKSFFKGKKGGMNRKLFANKENDYNYKLQN